MVRNVHFVGSYPAEDAFTAMCAMIEGAGQATDLIPDGDTGKSSTRRRGASVQHGFAPDSLARLRAFDFVAQAADARAVLDELEREYRREFTLQQGLPHYVDAALMVFPSLVAENRTDTPHACMLADHLHRQIHETIAKIGADSVLFQIDSVQALAEPDWDQARALSRSSDVAVGETVAKVINRATPQARFGVHLCLGDMKRQAVGECFPAAAPIASAVETIAEAVERPEALEYIHFPLAADTQPPSIDAEFYEPLARLRSLLPAETRIVAGLVHEHQAFGDQVRVRDLVEDAVGQPVDIATACGLGRRTPEVAKQLVGRMLELAVR